jgi:hypothetical protein
MLLNEHGNMCCLGFLCRQLGIEDILNIAIPSDIPRSVSSFREMDFLFSQSESGKFYESIIINLNDHREKSNEERELVLKKLFRRNHIELQFHGQYPDPIPGVQQELASEGSGSPSE